MKAFIHWGLLVVAFVGVIDLVVSTLVYRASANDEENRAMAGCFLYVGALVLALSIIFFIVTL